ncbi:hypothetical protein GmHk_06G017100 [Glycine max]|nr:hypothetical protein GmHk_06G017100 [Glycine max]
MGSEIYLEIHENRTFFSNSNPIFLKSSWDLLSKRASKKDKDLPTQAEMIIETPQSMNGKKPVDVETNDAIIKLQDLVENSGQSPFEAFMTMFGKEKSGRVCCLGRTKTPTLLKRNIEIKKRHANEVKELNDKIQEIKGKSRKEMAAAEEKRSQEMAAMDQKFQILLKTVLNQNDSKFNVAALISTPANANSGLHSSTSTHAPINED